MEIVGYGNVLPTPRAEEKLNEMKMASEMKSLLMQQQKTCMQLSLQQEQEELEG